MEREREEEEGGGGTEERGKEGRREGERDGERDLLKVAVMEKKNTPCCGILIYKIEFL